MMTGGSIGIAFGVASSRFESSFSVSSCWSLVSEEDRILLFTFPGMSALVDLNFKTKSQAFL